jgi:hypothetical protein
VRADIEGVSVPEQPCVLFFPDCVRERHLSTILNHVASSFRLNPRPLYLIFDNAPKGFRPEQQDIFERVPMPLSSVLKLALLSPSRTRIFRSVLVRETAN